MGALYPFHYFVSVKLTRIRGCCIGEGSMVAVSINGWKICMSLLTSGMYSGKKVDI